MAPGPIDENGATTLSGTLTVEDPSHAHTVLIDWGDQQTSTLEIPADQATFEANHTYLDNLPNDAAYVIQVTVTGPDGRVADPANPFSGFDPVHRAFEADVHEDQVGVGLRCCFGLLSSRTC